MLTTSAQKYFRSGVSFKRVLAISSKDLFFLFTTPFCWGALVEAKLHGESKVIQRCFDDNNDDNKR